MKSVTETIVWDLEELAFEGCLDCVLEISVQCYPPEPQTWEYPGSPADFEIVDWKVIVIMFMSPEFVEEIPVDQNLLKRKWNKWAKFESVIQDRINEEEERIFEYVIERLEEKYE